MIRKLGFEPEEAIRRFEAGRGHKFDHPELADDLRFREPAVDPEIRNWHSVRVGIEAGKEDSESDFDPDELEYIERRQAKNVDRFVSRRVKNSVAIFADSFVAQLCIRKTPGDRQDASYHPWTFSDRHCTRIVTKGNRRGTARASGVAETRKEVHTWFPLESLRNMVQVPRGRCLPKCLELWPPKTRGNALEVLPTIAGQTIINHWMN